MRVTRKILTRAATNLIFFGRFPWYILFSSLVSFALFVLLLFFCLFVCFLKTKICTLMHIRLCRQVNDKNFFTRLISGNKTICFGLDKENFAPLFMMGDWCWYWYWCNWCWCNCFQRGHLLGLLAECYLFLVEMILWCYFCRYDKLSRINDKNSNFVNI